MAYSARKYYTQYAILNTQYEKSKGRLVIFTTKRLKMVSEQIVRRGVTDPKVLDAMRKVERHLFVPPELQSAAYSDEPLPIGQGQTVSQPYIVAYMTEAARPGPEDRVLEVGTGSGYQSAILAELAKEVYSVEVVEPLAAAAAKRLSDIGYSNIHVRSSDGYKGWPEEAPFDVIMLTAAPPETPDELLYQLKTGGRMVLPVGSLFQELCLITRTSGGFKKRSLLPVRFVPMIHRDK